MLEKIRRNYINFLSVQRLFSAWSDDNLNSIDRLNDTVQNICKKVLKTDESTRIILERKKDYNTIIKIVHNIHLLNETTRKNFFNCVHRIVRDMIRLSHEVSQPEKKVSTIISVIDFVLNLSEYDDFDTLLSSYEKEMIDLVLSLKEEDPSKIKYCIELFREKKPQFEKTIAGVLYHVGVQDTLRSVSQWEHILQSSHPRDILPQWMVYLYASENQDNWKLSSEIVQNTIGHEYDPKRFIQFWNESVYSLKYDEPAYLDLFDRNYFRFLQFSQHYKKEFPTLVNVFGVSQFARLPVQIYTKALEQIHKKDLPTFLIGFPRYDDKGLLYDQNYNYMENIATIFDGVAYVRPFEFSTPEEWIEKIQTISHVYGNIVGMCVEAHGPTGMLMTDKYGSRYQLTSKSVLLGEHGDWQQLRSCFQPGAQIILNVCSAGQQKPIEKSNVSFIDALNSQIGVTIIAQTVNTGLHSIQHEIYDEDWLFLRPHYVENQMAVAWGNQKCLHIHAMQQSHRNWLAKHG